MLAQHSANASIKSFEPWYKAGTENGTNENGDGMVMRLQYVF